MARWSTFLARAASNLEHRLDKIKQWRERFDEDALVVFPYLTYGTPYKMWLKGRVLEASSVQHASAHDSNWRNLRNSLKRFSSDEVAGATLNAVFRGQNWQLKTDNEGFFETWLTLLTPCEAKIHQIQLELLSPLRPEQIHINFTANVIVPLEQAHFGIISDIDDTILKSDATSKRKAAQKILFGNAFTREAFEDVAKFYQALHQDMNPVFYVSSSPWNVYDVLTQFLELNDIPMGPLLLRDWGLSPDEILPTHHAKHKLSMIRQILETYPAMPFLLLGDSGQEDPEIYSQIVQEFPKRILGIYIRDVTGQKRKQSIETLAKAVAGNQSFLDLSHESITMMKDARARGLI
jgi:phosphatidate phosphatase APP1